MISSGTIRRLIAEEAGQSLLLAIVIVGALTITTAGLLTFMGSNETSAGRDREVVRSVSAAEAGLSNGISRIMRNDVSNTVAVNTTWTDSTTVDGASDQYTMTKSKSVAVDNTTTPPTTITSYVWNITSTATYGKVQRILSQQVKYIQGGDDAVVYKYGLFVGAPPAGTNPACLITLSGDVTVKANVYIGGNLCTNGGVTMKPPGDNQLAVYVKGYWNGTGSGKIGLPADKFQRVWIEGGCLDNKGNPVICSNGTNVFAYDTTVKDFPTLQKPGVNALETYNAASSWVNKCGGNFVLDNDTAMNKSVLVNGGEELFPNTAYTCTVPKTDGSTATMSWNPSTKTFNIVGTIFIDGDVSMQPTGSADVNWTGNGAIYVNGVLNKSSNNNICGPPKAGSGPTGYGCPQTWDTTAITRQGVTTAGSTTVTGLAATSDLAVGMYVNGPTIQTGTKIASIPDSATIVLTAPATDNGNPNLTFDYSNFGFVILNPANATNGYSSSGNGELDMDMYIVNGFANNGGTVVAGSVIADGGTVGGGTGFLYPQVPPPDFPINLPDVGWTPAPTGWKELK
jgi:Tfp pilus assembly protein PilX